MKVCFISGFYPKDWIGGAELQSYFIARELHELGHQVFFLAINTMVKKKRYEMDEGINVYRIRRCTNTFKYVMSIYDVVRNIRPDICYTRTRGELPLAFILTKIKHIPLVYGISSDSICYPNALPNKIWRPRTFMHQCNYWINQIIMNKVKAVISQSVHQYELLTNNFHLHSLIIGKGIPIVSTIVAKSKPPIVLWISNLKLIKRPELFIELAAKCRDLSAHFIMAGYPSDDSHYDMVVRRTKDIPNIRYIGGVSYEQGNELMKKSSIFINTSDYEGFPPTTFIQAWMHGVPTISFAVDPDGIMKRENIGICSGSLEQMVRDVELLIKNENIRRKMAERAREYMIKQYDIKKITRKYEGLFSRLIGDPKRL